MLNSILSIVILVMSLIGLIGGIYTLATGGGGAVGAIFGIVFGGGLLTYIAVGSIIDHVKKKKTGGPQ